MKCRPTVGGQAIIEGVMMRNGAQMALAVRQPDGGIAVEHQQVTSLTEKYPLLKKPILRGMVALGEALVYGMKALTTSAQLSGNEEEELSDSEMTMTMVVAILFAIALFIVLPTFVIKYLKEFIDNLILLNLAEGLLRLAIFLGYVVVISQMNDIKRVFEYHGAEHKTIHAFEAGVPLDVEHVRQYTTLHPRCGTSFLLIVMMVSMMVFTFLGWPNIWQRIISRIVLMPVIAGISYEIIRYAGRNAQASYMSWVIKPGLLLQKFTTREPDDAQLEVAIKALEAVLPQEESEKQESEHQEEQPLTEKQQEI